MRCNLERVDLLHEVERPHAELAIDPQAREVLVVVGEANPLHLRVLVGLTTDRLPRRDIKTLDSLIGRYSHDLPTQRDRDFLNLACLEINSCFVFSRLPVPQSNRSPTIERDKPYALLLNPKKPRQPRSPALYAVSQST